MDQSTTFLNVGNFSLDPKDKRWDIPEDIVPKA
jgi:hypothetical protein